MKPAQPVVLSREDDFDGFREAARRWLQHGRHPDELHWTVADRAAPDLFGDTAAAAGDRPPPAATARVAPEFIELCRTVVLHRDPARFALLYRLLWRLAHEPQLRHDALDPEMAQARRMAQAVRRDLHKMKAFVRFREVAQGEGEPPLHVAWFEPEHHIVHAVAPFFVRRFTAMRWAILSPAASLHWDGRQLHHAPGTSRDQAPPADAGEALWLTYYASIFNPARLKLKMMQKEMPRRYWQNLPESVLISTLAAQAGERSTRMVAAEPTLPDRRLPARVAPPRDR